MITSLETYVLNITVPEILKSGIELLGKNSPI